MELKSDSAISFLAVAALCAHLASETLEVSLGTSPKASLSQRSYTFAFNVNLVRVLH